MKLTDLPREKFKVKAQHFRFVQIEDGVTEFTGNLDLRLVPNYETIGYDYVHPKGGATVVKVINLETNISKIGVSFCSLGDTFSKKKGFQFALDRATDPTISTGNVNAATQFIKEYGTIYRFDA